MNKVIKWEENMKLIAKWAKQQRKFEKMVEGKSIVKGEQCQTQF